MRYLLMGLLFAIASDNCAWAQSTPNTPNLASLISQGYEIKAVLPVGDIFIQKPTSVFVCVYAPPNGRIESPGVLAQAVGAALCASVAQ